MFFTGMSPEPDTEAEYDDQYRQAGYICRFNKCFGAGLGVLHRVEALYFGPHHSNYYLRTITGFIFGFGTVWFLYPMMEEAFGDAWRKTNTKLAGQAGPAYSCTAQDVIDNGYCPYSDGTGRFNNNSANVTWDTGVTDFTERKFLQVATHEFMHLVGIGHSDVAESIMYADPYTNLQHLRPDDIEALQAMYGPPDTII
jgi:hypothetical protein